MHALKTALQASSVVIYQSTTLDPEPALVIPALNNARPLLTTCSDRASSSAVCDERDVNAQQNKDRLLVDFYSVDCLRVRAFSYRALVVLQCNVW